MAAQTDFADATTLDAEQIVATEHVSLTRAAFRRFIRHRLAVIGSIILLLVVFGALLADVISSRPFFTDVKAVNQAPSADHLLGTDRSGRDVWARIVHGARTSLAVGLGAVAIYVTIGTILGGLAGMLGGWVDNVIMRATDTLMSIPTLLLVIVFVAAIGPSLVLGGRGDRAPRAGRARRGSSEGSYSRSASRSS